MKCIATFLKPITKYPQYVFKDSTSNCYEIYVIMYDLIRNLEDFFHSVVPWNSRENAV